MQWYKILIIFVAVLSRLAYYSNAYRQNVKMFKCKHGEYISSTNVCNGTPECANKSDETSELCENVKCPDNNSFRCNYGACIPQSSVCNGFTNCIDGSDEDTLLCNITSVIKKVSVNLSLTINYEITTDAFRCDSGQMINKYNVCDGTTHCNDKSDEINKLCSEINCPGYAFKCHYGACIDANLICNLNDDCVDGSDENVTLCNSLSSKPPHSESSADCMLEIFQCSSGQSISEYNVCDGKAECEDQSDENQTICSNMLCPDYTFRCTYGACVPGDAICNGIVDCLDGSDEDYILCGHKLPDSPWIWGN